MQTSFTDLVGTAVVPAHCFDSTELTNLTPALDMATAAHDMAEQASDAAWTYRVGPGCTVVHDMAQQASEARRTGPGCTPSTLLPTHEE